MAERMANDENNQLEAVARALRELHRALVERVRRDYERERGSVLSPGEFLHLLTTDSRFAWLHPLSELMVDLDVFLEADPSPTEDEAAAVRVEVERLFAVPKSSAGANVFAVHYLPLIADDPQVAMGHAGVKQLVQKLPVVEGVNESEVLHKTHRWNEQRRHRR
jgi:hypothetical protein